MPQNTHQNIHHIVLEILGKWVHPRCSSDPGLCLGLSQGLMLGISWFPVVWQEPGRRVKCLQLLAMQSVPWDLWEAGDCHQGKVDFL